MHFLATIFGILLLFSIYAAVQFYSLSSFLLTNEVYATHIAASENAVQNALEDRASRVYSDAAQHHSPRKPAQHQRLSRLVHLPLLILVDPHQPQTGKYQSNIMILKNLISILYEETPFFKEAREARPDLLDELIRAILQKAYKIKIKSAEQLANLHLEDDLLQTVLYKMLVGSVKQDDSQKNDQQEGYPSLLEFISFGNQGQSVYVYLAPPVVLQAVFGDERIVDSIVQKRQDIHKQIRAAKREERNYDILSTQFQNDYKDRIPSNIDPSIISFRVSSTDPMKRK